MGRVGIKCYSCEQLSTGNYCSNCGHEHAEQPRNHWIYYLKLYAGMTGIIKNIRIFLFLLRAPIRHTMYLYKTSSLDTAVRFVVFSIALATFFKLSAIVTDDTSRFSSIYEVFFYLVVHVFFVTSSYFGLRYKNPYKFTPKQFIKMVSYVEGFLLILVFLYVLLVVKTPWHILIGSYAIISIVYHFIVWKSFARLTTASMMLRFTIITCLQIPGLGFLIFTILLPLANLLGFELV